MSRLAGFPATLAGVKASFAIAAPLARVSSAPA